MDKRELILNAFKTADYEVKLGLKKQYPEYFQMKTNVWYTTLEGNHVLKNSKGHYVGFGSGDEWFDTTQFFLDIEDLKEDIELKDIYLLLRREAVKRGFMHKDELHEMSKLSFNFTTLNYLKYDGKTIFDDGEWEQSPSKINELIDQLKQACEEEGLSVDVVIENENI
jgi:hypothetical protein